MIERRVGRMLDLSDPDGIDTMAGPVKVLAVWLGLFLAGAAFWAVTIYAVIKAAEGLGW